MLLRVVVNDVLVVDGMVVVDVYLVLTPDRLDVVDVSSPLALRYEPIKLDRRNGISRSMSAELLVLLEYVDFLYDSVLLDGKYVLLVVGNRVEIAGILYFVAELLFPLIAAFLLHSMNRFYFSNLFIQGFLWWS